MEITERIIREAERIAGVTGRRTFVIEIGGPVYVAGLEPGDRPLYTAEAPAGYGKRRPRGVAGRIVEILAKCETASPKQIREALGLSHKQVSNALARNLETFEKVAFGVWRLRPKGVRDIYKTFQDEPGAPVIEDDETDSDAVDAQAA